MRRSHQPGARRSSLLGQGAVASEGNADDVSPSCPLDEVSPSCPGVGACASTVGARDSCPTPPGAARHRTECPLGYARAAAPSDEPLPEEHERASCAGACEFTCGCACGGLEAAGGGGGGRSASVARGRLASFTGLEAAGGGGGCVSRLAPTLAPTLAPKLAPKLPCGRT